MFRELCDNTMLLLVSSTIILLVVLFRLLLSGDVGLDVGVVGVGIGEFARLGLVLVPL